MRRNHQTCGSSLRFRSLARLRIVNARAWLAHPLLLPSSSPSIDSHSPQTWRHHPARVCPSPVKARLLQLRSCWTSILDICASSMNSLCRLSGRQSQTQWSLDRSTQESSLATRQRTSCTKWALVKTQCTWHTWSLPVLQFRHLPDFVPLRAVIISSQEQLDNSAKERSPCLLLRCGTQPNAQQPSKNF